MATTRGVSVGDQAPDFNLPSQNGEAVSLAGFRGRSDVVLYFYPRDNTPVCTAEACAFRDSYEAFRDAGAQVIGVSADSDASHRQFAERQRLPFLLISDADGSLRARYGVPKTFGLFPGRTTYIIDREGIVRLIFNSQFQAARHVEEALQVLKELRSARKSETSAGQG